MTGTRRLPTHLGAGIQLLLFSFSFHAWGEGWPNGVVRSCEGRFRNYSWNSLLSTPEGGGRVLRHNDGFSRVATEKNAIIIVKDSNAASRVYIGKKGFLAKPGALKSCKSRTRPPFAGLVSCPPSSFSSRIAWKQEVERLKRSGYRVNEKEHFLVEKDGNRFYADYDLIGVYEANPSDPRIAARDLYSEDLRRFLNRVFREEAIQHPPLDNWELRHTVGLNPPVTAFLPDGSTVHLRDQKEVELFYRKHRIDWDRLWGSGTRY